MMRMKPKQEPSRSPRWAQASPRGAAAAASAASPASATSNGLSVTTTMTSGTSRSAASSSSTWSVGSGLGKLIRSIALSSPPEKQDGSSASGAGAGAGTGRANPAGADTDGQRAAAGVSHSTREPAMALVEVKREDSTPATVPKKMPQMEVGIPSEGIAFGGAGVGTPSSAASSPMANSATGAGTGSPTGTSLSSSGGMDHAAGSSNNASFLYTTKRSAQKLKRKTKTSFSRLLGFTVKRFANVEEELLQLKDQLAQQGLTVEKLQEQLGAVQRELEELRASRAE